MQAFLGGRCETRLRWRFRPRRPTTRAVSTDLIPDASLPAPLPALALEDFRAVGLAALFVATRTPGDDLEPVLRQAGAARQDAGGQALMLLADICSMTLVLEQPELA